jgi:hypothetical protein
MTSFCLQQREEERNRKKNKVVPKQAVQKLLGDSHPQGKAKNTETVLPPVKSTPSSIVHEAKADQLAIQLAKTNELLLRQYEEATNAAAKATAELLEQTKASKQETITYMAESKKEALEQKNETIKAMSDKAEMMYSKANKRKFLLDMSAIVAQAENFSEEKTKFIKMFSDSDI